MKVSWIPSRRDMDELRNALPVNTLADAAEKMHCSLTRVKYIKSYINHHPEEAGFAITSSQVGPSIFYREMRHMVIEHEDTRLIGMSANIRQVCTRMKGLTSEAAAIITFGTPVEKEQMRQLLIFLEPAIKFAEEVEKKVA